MTQYYQDWYTENELELKEDYLMQYKRGELLDFILEADGISVFEDREECFGEYCLSMFEMHLVDLGERCKK